MRHLPALDAEGRRWFAEVVADRLRFEHHWHYCDPEHTDQLVDWFVARASTYVRYVPPTVHCDNGRCCSSGYWTVLTAWVDQDLEQALPEVGEARARERAAEAERYPTLERWLEAEGRGQLTAPAPGEPSGLALVRGTAEAAGPAADGGTAGR